MKRDIQQIGDLIIYSIDIEADSACFSETPPLVFKDYKSNYFKIDFYYETPAVYCAEPAMETIMIHISYYEYEFYKVTHTDKIIKVMFKKIKYMDNNKFTAQDARNLAKQQEQVDIS